MEIIKNRIEKLRKNMKTGAVLLISGAGIRYMTGFDFSDGYILITGDGAYLFTDSRYIETARNKTGGEYTCILLDGGPYSQLAQFDVKTLGYEDRDMTCAAFNELRQALPLLDFDPVGPLLADMREYKEEVEIASVIAAQRIAEQALDAVLRLITPEITEMEVAAELEYQMRKLGAQGAAFETIAVSGSASSMPHGTPRYSKLERGFLTLDFGAVIDGYRSDMTRTVAVGGVTDEMRRVYDTVLTAQTAVLEAIGPGMLCPDADRLARDIIDNAGYGGYFGHGLGHGVGLNIHEAPRLSRTAGEKRLAPGHVVTVEPGIYLEGRFGVRIEDMVVIREDRVENITRAPKELMIL